MENLNKQCFKQALLDALCEYTPARHGSSPEEIHNYYLSVIDDLPYENNNGLTLNPDNINILSDVREQIENIQRQQSGIRLNWVFIEGLISKSYVEGQKVSKDKIYTFIKHHKGDFDNSPDVELFRSRLLEGLVNY